MNLSELLTASDMLQEEAKSYSRNHKNSWQTAFYYAIYDHYKHLYENINKQPNKVSTKYKVCPVCEDTRFLSNEFCPACEGLGSVLSHRDICLDDYPYFDCPKCGNNPRPRCRLCTGSGKISREQAVQLYKDRQ